MTEKTAEEITANFLAHLDAGDYTINEERDLDTKIAQHPKGYAPIKSNLVHELSDYTEQKNGYFSRSDPSSKKLQELNIHHSAVRCAILIRKARMENMIIENPSFRTKVEAKNKEIERLKEENSKLTKKVAHLERLNTELEKALSHFDKLKPKGEDGLI